MTAGQPARWGARLARRFCRSRRGNVAVAFALALTPMMVAAGGAIDFTRALGLQDELQNATDSAALGVARDGLAQTDAQLPATATSYMTANFAGRGNFAVQTATLDRGTMTAQVDTTASINTTFLKLIGISTLNLKAHSVAKGLGFEIALVLDTSGSMADSAGSGGSKIAALKTASGSLLDTLYGTTTVSNRFSISVVPFAASVNVGSANSGASWMDTTTTPTNMPIHDEDFDATVNRFTLFSQMKNVSWKGCVMTRPAPYDVDDTTPAASTPSSLFVPWFAPDEPGDSGIVSTANGYYNSYLDDDDGSCTSGMSSKQIATYATQTDKQKQSRTCKYKGATPKLSANTIGSIYGPNFLCDSQPITPLTNARATLNSAINALNAAGNTNILEGVTWGWRTLSPGAPFTQGKAYTAPANRKVIILMTDGQNSLTGVNNINDSLFSAYGYAAKGHAGSATSNNTTLTTLMNSKTLTACSNIKAKGITIYTIAFGADAAGSQALLQSCASTPAYFYAPQNSSDLQPVFVSIAQSINALRIAQ